MKVRSLAFRAPSVVRSQVGENHGTLATDRQRVAMSQASDGYDLRDSLIALPQRLLLLIACIPLAAVGLGVYLIFSETADSVRASGSLLITLSTPALTVAVGLAAAARVRTDDIDRLVATWLTHTVKDKLAEYLVGDDATPESRPFPPLFSSVQALADRTTSSFCAFEITDFEDRSHLLYVKSNIFNLEIGMSFALDDVPKHPMLLSDLEGWATRRDDPRVMRVTDTIYGAISEGYAVYITTGGHGDGDHVSYRFRQKLQTQFITSPYTRRYFAEDLAILSYFMHAEMRAVDALPGAGPAPR
jgi:hypothetical protein